MISWPPFSAVPLMAPPLTDQTAGLPLKPASEAPSKSRVPADRRAGAGAVDAGAGAAPTGAVVAAGTEARCPQAVTRRAPPRSQLEAFHMAKDRFLITAALVWA